MEGKWGWAGSSNSTIYILWQQEVRTTLSLKRKEKKTNPNQQNGKQEEPEDFTVKVGRESILQYLYIWVILDFHSWNTTVESESHSDTGEGDYRETTEMIRG